jgi:undecaprenyl-diphosphatase
LTEFLPVSSSAHLAVIPRILHMNSPLLDSLTFDVALHGGTLVALLIYFRRKIIALIKAFFAGLTNAEARKKTEFKTALFVLIAAVPAGLAGVIAGEKIEDKMRMYPALIGAVMLVFGLLLLAADKIGKKKKDLGSMTVVDSVVIGCAQILALITGVSRSGITIIAGLFSGFTREDAAEFSFLLSIPVIAGAFLFKLKHILHTGGGMGLSIVAVGFLAAAVSGFFAIMFLLDFVKKHSYLAFAVYRFIAGAALIVMFFRF